MTEPSGLAAVGMHAIAFTGVWRSVSARQPRSNPVRGWAGTSTTFMPSASMVCRIPK
jgi:hypothetical protein